MGYGPCSASKVVEGDVLRIGQKGHPDTMFKEVDHWQAYPDGPAEARGLSTRPSSGMGVIHFKDGTRMKDLLATDRVTRVKDRS